MSNIYDDDDVEEYDSEFDNRFGCLEGDEEEPLIDGVGFADPGGKSALRAETKELQSSNPFQDSIV